MPFALILALAVADPCDFIPDRGPTPDAVRVGRAFTGPVVHIIDGDGLCVGVGPRRGQDWVEVRVADFYAPELSEPGGAAARDALAAIASGRTLRCVAGRRSWDRVVAVCTLDGRAVGDLMRERGVAEGGRGR